MALRETIALREHDRVRLHFTVHKRSAHPANLHDRLGQYRRVDGVNDGIRFQRADKPEPPFADTVMVTAEGNFTNFGFSDRYPETWVDAFYHERNHIAWTRYSFDIPLDPTPTRGGVWYSYSDDDGQTWAARDPGGTVTGVELVPGGEYPTFWGTDSGTVVLFSRNFANGVVSAKEFGPNSDLGFVLPAPRFAQVPFPMDEWTLEYQNGEPVTVGQDSFDIFRQPGVGWDTWHLVWTKIELDPFLPILDYNIQYTWSDDAAQTWEPSVPLFDAQAHHAVLTGTESGAVIAFARRLVDGRILGVEFGPGSDLSLTRTTEGAPRFARVPFPVERWTVLNGSTNEPLLIDDDVFDVFRAPWNHQRLVFVLVKDGEVSEWNSDDDGRSSHSDSSWHAGSLVDCFAPSVTNRGSTDDSICLPGNDSGNERAPIKERTMAFEDVMGADLSHAAGAHHRRLSVWGIERHFCP